MSYYKRRYNIGDHVETEFLGPGKIVKKIPSALDSSLVVAYMVKFDEQPPKKYNLGQNPCMVFPESLRKIKAV